MRRGGQLAGAIAIAALLLASLRLLGGPLEGSAAAPYRDRGSLAPATGRVEVAGPARSAGGGRIRLVSADDGAASLPERPVRIAAVDAAGSGLPGVEIGPWEAAEEVLGSTGEDGVLEVRRERLRFGDDGLALLRARHPELATGRLAVACDAEGALVRLGPAASLHLWVLDEQGGPVAGARVRELVHDEPYDPPTTVREEATDERGALRLGGLVPGPHWLEVAAEGFAARRLTLISHTHTPVEEAIVLDRGRSLAVSVVDAEGRPIAGARVRAGERDRGATGADGTARFDALPSHRREIDVVVEHPAFCTRYVEATLETVGVTTELEVELEHGAALRVAVVDAEGRPVSGQVTVTDPTQLSSFGLTFALAEELDDEGTAELRGLTPDAPLEVGVHLAEVLMATLADVRVAAGEEREIELRVPAAVELSLRSADSDGYPVSGRLVLWNQDGLRSLDPAVDPDTPATFLVAIPTSGRARAHVPAGTYLARFDGEGCPYGRVFTLVLTRDEEVELLAPDGAVVSGRLVDAEGAPMAGELLRLLFLDGNPVTTTDGEGRFVFRRVSGDRGRLVLHGADGSTTALREPVAPGERGLRLVHARHPVHVVVRDFDTGFGEPAALSLVRTNRDPLGAFGTGSSPLVHRRPATDPFGELELWLPEGEWTAEASRRGYHGSRATFELALDHRAPDVELWLFRGVALTLEESVSRDEEGELSVEVQGDHGTWRRTFRVPAGEGAHRLDGRVPRGTASWELRFPAGPVRSGELDLVFVDEGRIR